jgi:hypothetical protein
MADYGFVHEGKVFTPDGTPHVNPTDSDARNRAIERAELEVWDGGPDSFVAYYDDKRGTITTWLGTHIGDITSSSVYGHNFGSRMISVRVTGTNGVKYYGRASYDNGNCVTLRKLR